MTRLGDIPDQETAIKAATRQLVSARGAAKKAITSGEPRHAIAYCRQASNCASAAETIRRITIEIGKNLHSAKAKKSCPPH